MPINVIYPLSPQFVIWALQSFVDMQMPHMFGCPSENVCAPSSREPGQMHAGSLHLTRELLGQPCDGHCHGWDPRVPRFPASITLFLWESQPRLLGQQKGLIQSHPSKHTEGHRPSRFVTKLSPLLIIFKNCNALPKKCDSDSYRTSV